MQEKQGAILVQRGVYNALKQGKEQYEAQVDGKVVWAAFLLFLLGLYVASQSRKEMGGAKVSR